MFTRIHDEAGLTTAEYAAGTVGVCTLGGILAVVAKSDWFAELVRGIFEMLPTIIQAFV